MTFRFPLLCSVTAVLGGAATAQTECPTASDLRAGITLEYADGYFEIYRETAPGFIVVEGYDGVEQYMQLELAHGTHLLSYVGYITSAPDESSRQTYDYGMEIDAMPTPTDGGRFEASVTVTASDGRRPEDQMHAYAAGDDLIVGGCVYEVIDALIAYDSSDNYMELIRYLPELELGYLLWNQSDIDGRSPDYIVTSITTTK